MAESVVSFRSFPEPEREPRLRRSPAERLAIHIGSRDMAEVTTDHRKIKKWAEAHGGRPAAVDRTHHDDDVGIVRLMFPDAPQSEHTHLVPISWDEFFKEFDERKLALIYDPASMFSKIVGRDSISESNSRQRH
jgi:hypothetical protein